MNLLDIIIVAAMIFFIVRGLLNGFIKEIASLAGIVLGIWLGILHHPSVASSLQAFLPAWKYIQLFSFGLIFFLVFITFSVIGWVLKALFEKVFLGWLDKGLGTLLAVLKGIILTYLVIILLSTYVPSKARLVAESELAHFVVVSYQTLAKIIPPGLYHDMEKKLPGSKTDKSDLLSQEYIDSGNGFG
jgi:membrane protein required for colicin V production